MTVTTYPVTRFKSVGEKMKTSSDTRNFFILILLVKVQISFIVSVSVTALCKQNSAMA